MTNMHDREKAMENKFAMDEATRFRVEARAVKLFGLKIAADIGRTDADAYARELVAANLDEPGLDDVVRAVAAGLAAAGKTPDETALAQALQECLREAAAQIQAEAS